MKIEIEMTNEKLFYRHFSHEHDKGVCERPLKVSDLSAIGKIVDLCDTLFSHKNSENCVESITYKLRNSLGEK